VQDAVNLGWKLQLVERVTGALPHARYFLADPNDPSYGLTPLEFAPTPASRWRALFDDVATNGHLDRLAAKQHTTAAGRSPGSRPRARRASSGAASSRSRTCVCCACTDGCSSRSAKAMWKTKGSRPLEDNVGDEKGSASRRDDQGFQVSPSRRISLAFGVLFLITFITAIGALIAFQPVLDDPAGYVAGDGSDNRIYFGALLELLLIIANIGTAIVVFPILRRQNEILALGYVTARIVECAFILVGIIAVLSLVTLGQEDSGAEAGRIGYTLAEIKDWTFILGPGWVVGVGNGLILGYLMYRSGLVPRPLAALGLIGGPLIVLSGTLVLFDVIDQGGTGQGLATIPEFFWELGLGLYATVKGFRASPILTGESQRAAAARSI